jgi:hypothetical protein
VLQASRQASSRGLILRSWRRLLGCALAHSHTWERPALLDRVGHRFANKRDKALAVLGSAMRRSASSCAPRSFRNVNSRPTIHRELLLDAVPDGRASKATAPSIDSLGHQKTFQEEVDTAGWRRCRYFEIL